MLLFVLVICHHEKSGAAITNWHLNNSLTIYYWLHNGEHSVNCLLLSLQLPCTQILNATITPMIGVHLQHVTTTPSCHATITLQV